MFASRGFLLLSCVCLSLVVSSTRANSDEDICTEPPDPVNGYKRTNQGNRVGDAIEFRCFENATMVGVRRRFRTVPGTVTAVCMRNGDWSHEVPTCVLKACPPLVAPRNGFIRGLDGVNGSEYGMKYAIGCDQGYRLKDAEPGEEIWTECLDNGTWSGQPAECEVVKCPTLEAPANGYIKALGGSSGYVYGSAFAIRCNHPGYKLQGKEPRDEIYRVCQHDGQWSGQQSVPVCQDRKIFHSRKEWSDFFTNNLRTGSAPWREHGYQWKSSCRLSEGVKEECLWTGWHYLIYYDSYCRYNEIKEYGRWESYDRKQVWYALLGVKVEKFGNQCCYVKNGQDYPCYESYTGAR